MSNSVVAQGQRFGENASMTPLLLQDFITVKGASSTSVIQSSPGWLDLGPLEDIVIFTDVREAFGSVSMQIETAPVAQENDFVTVVPPFTLATGLRTDVVTAALAKVPPARFLRWHLVTAPGSMGDATFRIWIAGYGWAP